MRECKHRKKVFCCLSSNRLPTKLFRHICLVWRKLFTTLQFYYDTENFFTKKYPIYFRHISPIKLQKKVNAVYLELNWYPFSIVFPYSQSNRASDNTYTTYKIRVIKRQAETFGKCQLRVNGTISNLNSRKFDRKYRKFFKYTTP